MATRVRDPGMAGGPSSSEPTVIRPMTAEDLTRVLEIERASFSVPWTPATFRGLLNRADTHLRVAESGGEVVGYAVVWIVLDQGELGDIAVVDGRRGAGIGTALLMHVLDLVREQGVRELYLEVRESNVGAQRLYERHGFRLAGRRPGYYSRPKEDALVLRRAL